MLNDLLFVKQYSINELLITTLATQVNGKSEVKLKSSMIELQNPHNNQTKLRTRLKQKKRAALTYQNSIQYNKSDKHPFVAISNVQARKQPHQGKKRKQYDYVTNFYKKEKGRINANSFSLLDISSCIL